MYRDDYFYGIIDILQYNIYASFFKDKIIEEENGVIEVFKKNKEVIVIEVVNGKETIIKDSRKDKNIDITNYDLVYLKAFNRYYIDYNIKGMVYVNIDNICFYRVKIDGYNPNDKLLRVFYLKNKVSKDELVKYANNNDELKYLEKFYDIKKDIVFNRPSSIRKLFKF